MLTAVIGGTGFSALGEQGERETVGTPYGDAEIFRLPLGGQSVIFLPRHGAGHSLAPHRVNYRANIWALHALGVDEVLATLAVGSLNSHIAPGHFALPSQFIDWTKSRPATFFDGDDGTVRHVDVSHPYCARMTRDLLDAGDSLGQRLHAEAVYACTEGPRFETAAEIHALRLLGADVVGMTSVPEAVLAREAGLCYAAISIVCNWAAGMTNQPLMHTDVLRIIAEQADTLLQLITRYLALRADGECNCKALGFGKELPK